MRPAQVPTLAPSITVTAPITYQAPPPALVSADVGAEHVGCTRAALADHLAWMARHPRWRDRVIEASRKRRFAAPADVIDSMRERYAARQSDVAPPANDAAPEPTVDGVLAELGHVRRPAPAKVGRR